MRKIFAFLVVSLFLLSACSAKIDKEKVDALAKCMVEKGVKEYGAFWCANCAKQKKMFGSSYDILMSGGVYVECDARGENEQSELCLEIGVERYPHWVFNKDVKNPTVGVTPLEDLARLSGCPYEPAQ